MSRQDTIGPAAAATQPAPGGTPRRTVVYLGLAAGVVLVLVLTAMVSWIVRASGQPAGSGNGGATSKVPVAWARPAVAPNDLAQRSGVRITRVAISGDGGLVDLRFQVMDADLAGSLHDPKTPPAIVDEASGLVVRNLLMDHAHTGAFKAGVTYYLVFENPGNWVHSGSLVTVLLGNAQVEHVVVL